MDPKDREHLRARFLTKYPRSQRGVWLIRGEDDNADLAGPHDKPKLAKVTGTYEQAVDYALDIPRFVSWGRGGSIEPVVTEPIIDLDNLQEDLRKKLLLERDGLNRRIDEIEEKLRAIPRKG
jgi:hypothetical protein